MPVRKSTDTRHYSDQSLLVDAPGYDPHLYVAAATADLDPFDTDRSSMLELKVKISKHYQTALTGSNNDVNWIARDPAATPSITYVKAGDNTPLTVDTVSHAVTVNLATDGSGNVTSTAQDVIDAVNADPTARQVLFGELQAGNDGTGIPTAMSVQNLVAPSGSGPVATVDVLTSLDDDNYYSALSDAVTTFLTALSGVQTVKVAVGPLGSTSYLSITIGGTTPKLAIAVEITSHR